MDFGDLDDELFESKPERIVYSDPKSVRLFVADKDWFTKPSPEVQDKAKFVADKLYLQGKYREAGEAYLSAVNCHARADTGSLRDLYDGAARSFKKCGDITKFEECLNKLKEMDISEETAFSLACLEESEANLETMIDAVPNCPNLWRKFGEMQTDRFKQHCCFIKAERCSKLNSYESRARFKDESVSMSERMAEKIDSSKVASELVRDIGKFYVDLQTDHVKRPDDVPFDNYWFPSKSAFGNSLNLDLRKVQV